MSHYEECHSAEFQARELGACLREAAVRESSVEHLALEAERLRRAVSQIGRGEQRGSFIRAAWARKQVGRGMGLLAVAAVVAVLMVVLWIRQHPPILPLAYEVVGPGKVSASYVATPDQSSALLKFTDGSTVIAHQATRLRVSELRLDGATLVLERGKATVEVVHRNRRTRWNVVAGPFSIAVTGTKFVVEWVPAAGKFAVSMLDGRVEVDGPRFTAPATLRGGQRIEADAFDADWAVTPLLDSNQNEPPPRDAVPKALEQESATLSQSTKTTAARPQQSARALSAAATGVAVPIASASAAAGANASAAVPTFEARPWSKMVALGESQRVVSEAEAMGVKVCLGQCGASDLRALADAARYSGRLDLAEASLRSLRERYPAQAAVAAYLLGAVDEARGRNASALRWYEEYVAAASNGGFSSEALAGRLRMLVATNGYTSARKAAQQYLELYPGGVGAKTAKQILERR